MRRQQGSMQQINYLIWPALYGYTAWIWSAELGWLAATGATVAAVVAGAFVGGLMSAINPFVLGPIVGWLALLLPWFLDAETWRWTALVLCLAPLPVIALGLALRKTWT